MTTRRSEITHGMDYFYTEGYKAVMITLTFPHRAWHDFETLISKQQAALKYLRQGNPWTKFKKRHGYQGLIRAWETTHGRNGFHPHTHELWFVNRNANAAAMQQEILTRWESACARAGLLDLDDEKQLIAFRDHSVDIHDDARSGEYLAKLAENEAGRWAAESEIASGHRKSARRDGRTMWQVLSDADTCKKSARVFLQFSTVARDKRMRAIYWSPGLKKRVGIVDLKDEALAVKQDDRADLLGQLTRKEWRTVIRNGARATILDCAENGGWDSVSAWLSEHSEPASSQKQPANDQEISSREPLQVSTDIHPALSKVQRDPAECSPLAVPRLSSLQRGVPPKVQSLSQLVKLKAQSQIGPPRPAYLPPPDQRSIYQSALEDEPPLPF